MTEIVVTAPMIITSRLLPGVKIGDVQISIQMGIWDGHGYTFTYWIDDLRIKETLCVGDDLSIVPGTDNLYRTAMYALLGFLLTDAEKFLTTRDEDLLFNGQIASWAYQHSDEITMMALEINGDEEN